MKHIALYLVLILFSFNSFAAFDEYVEKPFSFGIGTYRTIISFDETFFEDDELTGVALTFGYALSNNVALRGTYFSLEHDDFSNIDSTGFDALAYYGTGLASQGFKIYIGGGYFRDEWEVGSFSQKFDGLQINGGLGYNWQSVSLDLILGLRDAGDYEDFINDIPPVTNFSATAASGSLLVSFRF